MSGGDFSAGLWQVRRQLGLLLFNLETQRVHLSLQSLRWLPFTTEAIERALERLRFDILAVNVQSAALAAVWGGPAEAGLPALIAFTPPGAWPELLEDHRSALVRLADEVSGSREQNIQALDAVDTTGPTAPEYAAHGGIDEPTGLIFQANVNRALDVLAKSALPQLDEFLGRPGRADRP